MSGFERFQPSVLPGLLYDDGESVRMLAGLCPDCGRWTFPTPGLCPACQSTRIAAEPLSTVGTVYTFTVVRSRPPGYSGPVPYGLGLIELPEGLYVFSTLTGDLDNLRIGDPMRMHPFGVGETEPLWTYAFAAIAGEQTT